MPVFACCACGRPLPALLVAYTGCGAASVARCAGCGCAADPYLERDGLLLAIDLLLVRPGALRHVFVNQPALSQGAPPAAPAPAAPARRAAPPLWRLALVLLALDTYSAAFHALAPSSSSSGSSSSSRAAAGADSAGGAGATAAATLPWLPIDPLAQHASLVAVFAAASGDARTQARLRCLLTAERPWLLPHWRTAEAARTARAGGVAAGRAHPSEPTGRAWWGGVEALPPQRDDSGVARDDAPCPPPPPPRGGAYPEDDPECEELAFHCSADRCTVPTLLTGAGACAAWRRAAAAAASATGAGRPLAHPVASSDAEERVGAGLPSDHSGAVRDAARVGAAVSAPFAHLLLQPPPPHRDAPAGGAATVWWSPPPPPPPTHAGGAAARAVGWAVHAVLPANAVHAAGRVVHAAAAALPRPSRLHVFVLAVGACVAVEWAAYVLAVVACTSAAVRWRRRGAAVARSLCTGALAPASVVEGGRASRSGQHQRVAEGWAALGAAGTRARQWVQRIPAVVTRALDDGRRVAGEHATRRGRQQLPPPLPPSAPLRLPPPSSPLPPSIADAATDTAVAPCADAAPAPGPAPGPATATSPPLAALLLCSYGKAALLLSMVWPYPRSATLAVDAYVLGCHAAALHVATGLPPAVCGAAVGAGLLGAAAARAALLAAGLRPLRGSGWGGALPFAPGPGG